MNWTEMLTILLAVAGIILSALQLIIAWKQLKLSRRESKNFTQDEYSREDLPQAGIKLLKLTVSSREKQENIIGDLIEERRQLQSGEKVRLWMYRQVIKSIPSLAYRRLSGSISKYKKRIR
jgi:hypothetical protein